MRRRTNKVVHLEGLYDPRLENPDLLGLDPIRISRDRKVRAQSGPDLDLGFGSIALAQELVLVRPDRQSLELTGANDTSELTIGIIGAVRRDMTLFPYVVTALAERRLLNSAQQTNGELASTRMTEMSRVRDELLDVFAYSGMRLGE